MARYNIYLRKASEENLLSIFEHLKIAGEIPMNAADVGEYRAQCISYALGFTAWKLSDPISLPEVYKQLSKGKSSEG